MLSKEDWRNIKENGRWFADKVKDVSFSCTLLSNLFLSESQCRNLITSSDFLLILTLPFPKVPAFRRGRYSFILLPDLLHVGASLHQVDPLTISIRFESSRIGKISFFDLPLFSSQEPTLINPTRHQCNRSRIEVPFRNPRFKPFTHSRSNRPHQDS